MKMSIEAARCRFNIDWRSLEGRRVHREGECACACVACTLPLPGTRRPSKLHSAASLGLQPTATAALANIQKTLQLKTARFIFTYARAGHLMLNELKFIRCSHTRCPSKFVWTSMQHQSAINASDIQGERHSCWPYFWSCRCDFTVQSPRQTRRSSLWMHVQLFVFCAPPRESSSVFTVFCSLSLSNGRCVLMSRTLLLFVF